MEIHQLKYFVAVAQTGSFSRAAERCFVSQPSLSQQIQKLEKSVKQKLFDRLGRKVTLTQPGRLLLERATTILAEVEDVQRQLREGEETRGGKLVIGAIPTIAPYLFPPALEKLLRRRPQVELNVREDVTQHILAATLAGELDIGIVALPINEERLHVEPLFTEPLYLALPKRHPLTRSKRITAQDLQSERFILLDEMHCLGDQIVSFCNANGCQPRIACRSAQLTTIQVLIAHGHGISLLPDMARRADTSGAKVYRDLAGTQPTRTIAVIWRRQRYLSPVAEDFLTGLRHIARRFGIPVPTPTA